ncbi:MAG: class I SAM-dependent methyltransferase [Candidatus Rokubacteria bacterium]|nr:class I SAM-dependent methyltransferase [Candidatus Rokubacteria bacterium]
MSQEPKATARRYFDAVAPDYLERYYDPATSRYPNLQLRAAIVAGALREAVPADACILDAGCGAGHFLVEAARAGYRAVGVDIAPRMAARARGLIGTLPPELRSRCGVGVGDVERLAFRGKTFDAATASGVFEYLGEDARGLAELRRVLRPGGLALVSFRNRGFNTFSANAYTADEFARGTLGGLLDAVQTAIAADAERITALAPAFADALAAAAAKPRPPASGCAARAADEGRWEKTMSRRQHTVEEVRSAAVAAGFRLERVSYFHFHAFPPAVGDLLADAARVLGLAMEVFRDTALGALFASGFVAQLRAM